MFVNNTQGTIIYQYFMTKIHKVDLIVLFIFAVLGLIPPAAIIARHFYDIDPIAWLNIHWGRTVLGYIFLTLAVVVCLFNFYVSIYVPWVYEKKHGSLKDFAHMSGLPMLGSILVFCAGALLPSSPNMGVFLLLLYVIDGNGLPYFFYSIFLGGLN